MQFRLKTLLVLVAVGPPLLPWIVDEAQNRGRLWLALMQAVFALWPLVALFAALPITWCILSNLEPVLRRWLISKWDRKRAGVWRVRWNDGGVGSRRGRKDNYSQGFDREDSRPHSVGPSEPRRIANQRGD